MYDADGMNGYKPQELAATYQNKQGDCKARCVLLKCVLNYLGVDPLVVLVNYSVDFCLKYYLLPLLSFNHAVVRINHQGRGHSIDTTAHNEFDRLEECTVTFSCFYMKTLPDQELQVCEPTRSTDYCVDGKASLIVKENKGKIELLTTHRYSRANTV